jgi:eukaryotic-like serine/threonine-protein kinase
MTSMLTPTQFAGAPLADLVHALAAASPADVPLAAGEFLLHGAAVERFGVTAAPTEHPHSTRHEDTRLPLDHPDVEVPGVTLETYLGGGGQGWVYAGRVRATNKVVAVKVLARGRNSSDWGAREAILCARVRHPNVLRVLRTQPAGAFWVVLMELVLGEEIGSERLDPPAARACFAQLADALAALARQQLVHRDIKPTNVLLRRPDRSPVLIDFGLAVEFGEAAAAAPDLSGTPFFMPPEAWRDEPPGPAWDAYALGVTAAVALAGRPEMPTDLPSLREAKLSGVFERRLTRAIADPDLRSWVESMTAAEPAARSTAVELARRWVV